MRLIDADALIKSIDETSGELKNRFVKSNQIKYLYSGQMLEIIKQEILKKPTAYDVDKVVEELEFLQDNCFQNGIIDAYENAIEIVKRGGVDE